MKGKTNPILKTEVIIVVCTDINHPFCTSYRPTRGMQGMNEGFSPPLICHFSVSIDWQRIQIHAYHDTYQPNAYPIDPLDRNGLAQVHERVFRFGEASPSLWEASSRFLESSANFLCFLLFMFFLAGFTGFLSVFYFLVFFLLSCSFFFFFFILLLFFIFYF